MKKKLGVCLAAIAAVFIVCSCAVKRGGVLDARSVSVTGTGAVIVIPDRAQLSVAVVTRADDVLGAANENAQKMIAAQNAITVLGVEKKDLSTSNYNVTREMNYRDGVQVPGMYRVTNRLNITLKDPAILGSVIDAALVAGANEIASLEFSSSEKENATKEARRLAINQAQAAARLLAEESKARLGKALFVSEMETPAEYRSPAPVNARMFSDAAQSTPIAANSTTVTVTVQATYELK
jgi:uncharacterized protein YggE